MRKRKINSIYLILVIVFSGLTGCNNHDETSITWKYQDGYVPNEDTAIKIAEIVCLNVYGKEINEEKPFTAKLKDGKVWVIEGTFNKGKYAKGGVAYIEIQKGDGKILKVIHGK